MSTAVKAIVICVVIEAHLAVDVILLAGDWKPYVWAVLWPTSQCSLVALWAGLSRRHAGLRAAGGFLGTAATWLLHCRVWGVLQEHRWAAVMFGTAFAVHALTIVVLVMVGRYGRWLIRHRMLGDEVKDTQPLQFSLRCLLAWTAIVAIGLGVGTTALARVEFPRNFFSFWLPTQSLGVVLLAGFAALLMWSLVGPWRWVFPKVVLSFAIIGCGAYLSPYLFGLLDPIYLFPPLLKTACVNTWSYVGCLCLTLLPLGLCGCFRGTMGAGESCRRSPTRPAEPTAEPKEVSE